MPGTVIESQVDPKSAAFRENYEAMRALVEEFHARQERVRQGSSERARQKHVARGKLLPRERVELLLDPGAPFLELSTLAAWGMYDDESPAGSGINGIGVVNGVEVMVGANDATAKGGASYPISVKKALRAQEIAAQNRLPYIYLVESAGANLLYQAELFADLGGRTFANQARMSAAGIPQIALVFGNSTAGGAYVPGLSDYTVMVKRQAKVFLAGPPLVKMATGEETDDESLGGAELHARRSGLADFLAEDDADAIRIGRDIVTRLNWRKEMRAALAPPEEPLYDPDELLGIVPPDPRRPFEIREVIARLVDGSRFDTGLRLGASCGLSGGHPRQQRRALLRIGAEGRAVHPALQPVAHAADLPAEHHRLHGRPALRGAGHHQARCADDQRRRQRQRAAVHRHRRRQLRRR
jgi:3-methylcrotonyl-CoA carboxylase beta subunit